MTSVHQRAAREPVDGVLLLDKPAGLTSNEALQRAKRLLGARKGGHTGSLDPIATGLLPLCFGEATKLSQFLLDAEKRYRAIFRLGVSTNTYDAEGTVERVRPVAVSARAVKRALAEFEGEIEQQPPMYSAVKLGGRPLYELARAGIEVERAPRRVVIHEIVLHGFEGDRVDVEIACSKGTYIRTLAHDLGERLGCGAHVLELRRLAVGGLSIERAVSLERLEALPDAAARRALLVPADVVVEELPSVRLTPLATHYLLRGQAVTAAHRHAPGWVRLYDDRDRFLGMGQVLDDGRVAPRRLMAVKG
ncbi:MAG TPA: tRNA pseudouridine(55) synthase TruB [Burkholderiales bacterium]